MVSPRRQTGGLIAGITALLVVFSVPVWLSWLGTGLTREDPLAAGDVALVLEGTGALATDAAEQFRRDGLVHDVVIVEAPVKTHALVAYWSDFVGWGLAAPAATPPDHLRIVRAASTQAGEQARAALPALQAVGTRAVLVLGGGGIGSRLVERELTSVFAPASISVRMVHYGTDPARDPAHWYQNAEDRRAVLDGWLQLLVPYLGGYDVGR